MQAAAETRHPSRGAGATPHPRPPAPLPFPPMGTKGIIAAGATIAGAAAELTLEAMLELRDAIAGPPRITTPDLLGTLSNAELDALKDRR